MTENGLVPYQSDSGHPKLKSFALAQADPRPVMTAGQLMSTPVKSAEANWTLERARDFMAEHEISHLPILADERVIGLVSDRDILRYPAQGKLTVEAVMSSRLLTATPDSNLWSVAKIMLAEHIHCVVLVDLEGCLQGILTRLDLLGCMTHHAPIEVWM
jgi:CBS domain-containing protein